MHLTSLQNLVCLWVRGVSVCGCVSVCWVVEKFKSNSYIAIYLSKHHPHDYMHCLPLMFLPLHFQHKIKIGL